MFRTASRQDRGPITTPANPTFLISGMPVAGMGSMATCAGVPPVDSVVMGNPTYLAPVPAAATGAVTAHGGTIPMGNPTYLVM